jgi:hypothetical protein
MNLRMCNHISDQNESDQNERLATLAWAMVVMLAVLVSAVQLGTMVSLLVGRFGFSGIFPLSIGAASVVGCILLHQAGFQQSSLWLAGGLFCLAIILSLALSAFFFDFSWDGLPLQTDPRDDPRIDNKKG